MLPKSPAVKRRGSGSAIARFLVRSSILIAMTFAVSGLAVAQVDPAIPPDMADRFAFDAADTNGDGYVSEGELARDAAVGFSSLDKDRSQTLTPQELGPHDPAWFARVDRNHDGVLTFSEVMTNKLEGLKAGDKDHDDRLSFEEMVNEVAAEEAVR
jgi:Ca2+-binding EF-hand superfamily protein